LYQLTQLNAVGVATTSFGFQQYVGETKALAVNGSLVQQDVISIDATKYKSGTILVAARKSGGQREIDEFTWLADGANNVIFTAYGNMLGTTDVGALALDMASNTLKLKHTPPVGVAVTISTLARNVGVAQTVTGTGITGNYEIGDTALSNTYTTITATGSPSTNIISQKNYSNYSTCKYRIEIQNTTDSTWSTFVVGSNSYGGNSNWNRYNNLSTATDQKRDMRATDIYVIGGNTQLRFTPLANKAYIVRVSEMKIDKPDVVSSNITFTL